MAQRPHPQPPRSRAGIIHGALLLFAVLLVGRAAQVQLLDGDRWERLAQGQQFSSTSLPAPRGAVLDAAGEVLAMSREVVRISVAPREVRERDRAALRTALEQVDVSRAMQGRATDTTRRWVDIPGSFLPADVAPLLALRGVHARPAIERVYPRSEGTARIVGHATLDGEGVDGVELALDSLLRGTSGETRELRDARGRRFASPVAESEAPRPGNTVVLTLNHQLQDIAEHAVGRAMEATGASGGDIVVLDPHAGEILALASRRAGSAMSGVPAFTETYEPGSTIKPFLAARLLAAGRARVDEMIATYDGSYMAPGRRTPIRDVHRAQSMSVADIIRHSSNVGIVRLAERISAAEQYEALRDFGFGTATGVAYPSEASGSLPVPARWSRTTPAALAMGYELGATPLQVANAYAAIANGGELLEPALVKEIRSPDGEVLYRHQRRVVRRVVPEETARVMRGLLASVVDSGTARDATLTTYAVGGKSGTARLTSGGRYEGGAYTASFVALFPAEEPQFVVLVKLDRPQGVYYGGATAGPVSKAVLEAALAARDAALDRGELARRVRLASRPEPKPAKDARRAAPSVAVAEAGQGEAALGAAALGEAALGQGDAAAAPARAVEFTVGTELHSTLPAPAAGRRRVPDVSGLPTRLAVRRLHDAGFQVRLVRGGAGVAPAAGSEVAAGSVVRLAVRP